MPSWRAKHGATYAAQHMLTGTEARFAGREQSVQLLHTTLRLLSDRGFALLVFGEMKCEQRARYLQIHFLRGAPIKQAKD